MPNAKKTATNVLVDRLLLTCNKLIFFHFSAMHVYVPVLSLHIHTRDALRERLSLCCRTGCNESRRRTKTCDSSIGHCKNTTHTTHTFVHHSRQPMLLIVKHYFYILIKKVHTVAVWVCVVVCVCEFIRIHNCMNVGLLVSACWWKKEFFW